MCEELVKEYRVWLEELLEILENLCEDIVPAGRLDDEIYWRTKRLYDYAGQLGRDGNKKELEILLRQYGRDGRGLLEQIRVEIKGKGSICGGNCELCLQEETKIRLRHAYANEILNSLQMLVNLAFLLGEYLNCPVTDVKELFELDAEYVVKHVRSGFLVK